VSHKNNTVLVTGASGFVGRYTVPGLLERGWNVKAFVRRLERGQSLKQCGATLVQGDLLDRGSLLAAVDGCTAVVHLAGLGYSSNEALNHEVNVVGSRNLADACVERKVQRVVNVSSTCAGRARQDSYGRTKELAEREFAHPQLHVTHLRPTMIYGQGSDEFDRFAAIVRRAPRVPIPGDGTYRLRPVCIHDVVELFDRVLKSPEASGKVYDVAGPEPIAINDFITLVGQLQGKRTKILHVPERLALFGARILGKMMAHPPANMDQVLAFLQDTEVEIGPACQDFTWAPRSLQSGLEEVLRSAP